MSVLRQQEQQRLAEEQARTLVLVSEKQELEEKLTALSRRASGTILENFVDLQEYIRRKTTDWFITIFITTSTGIKKISNDRF